jgi:hypothetical protein
MSREINLLNPLLHKKRFSFTSASAMLGGIGTAVALAAMVSVYESNELQRVETQARAVTQSLKDIKAKQEVTAAAKTVPRKADPGVEAKVVELNSQLKAREDVVEALRGGAVGTTAGFSEYMRAFSRQRVEGVWLTGFDIAGGGADLTITGRALTADLVPHYLLGLKREAPMQGRQFASVVIRQAKSAREPARALPGDKETPLRGSLPPYVDFTVSSGDLGATRGRAETGETAKPPPEVDTPPTRAPP